MSGQDAPSGWSELFRLAFERSANSMLVLEPGKGILTVNPAFERNFGYPRRQLIGRPLASIVPPDRHEQLEGDLEELRQTGSLEGERELLHADGHRVRVQFATQRATIGGHTVDLCVQLGAHLEPMRAGTPPAATGQALTQRELDVVTEIALGKRAQEIGEDLFISPATVRTHVRNAMLKVGARSQAQLVAIVLTTGSIDHGRCRQLAGAGATPAAVDGVV